MTAPFGRVKLSHRLEEYKHDHFSEIEFTESDYTIFYRDIVRELKKLKHSKRRPEALKNIIKTLTAAGRCEYFTSIYFMIFLALTIRYSLD